MHTCFQVSWPQGVVSGSSQEGQTRPARPCLSPTLTLTLELGEKAVNVERGSRTLPLARGPPQASVPFRVADPTLSSPPPVALSTVGSCVLLRLLWCPTCLGPGARNGPALLPLSMAPTP